MRTGQPLPVRLHGVDNHPKGVLLECLKRCRFDVSKRADAEHECGSCRIVGEFRDRDDVVVSHCEVELSDFAASLLGHLAGTVCAIGGLLAVSQTLVSLIYEIDIDWHSYPGNYLAPILETNYPPYDLLAVHAYMLQCICGGLVGPFGNLNDAHSQAACCSFV